MTKQAITIISSVETFNNLQSFESVQALNESVRAYLSDSAIKPTKSSVAILKLLHRHSCKYYGVSFLSKNTIATKLDISRMTVIRCCKKLEEYGIIKQYEMKRKSDMLQSSNAIVIQPFVTQEEPNLEQKCDSNKTTSTLKTNTKDYVEEPAQQEITLDDLDSTFIPDEIVPEGFKTTVKPFFSATEAIQLWKRVEVAHSKSALSNAPCSYLNSIVRAFKETVYQSKVKRVKSFYGYFYRVVQAYLSVEKRREVNNLPNWLY
ncbi:winged helix-turn-helix domain-containing protein [Alkalicoccobacillus gibsonii]|uniref:winged helix-turn-helix domain-containing protein n=1 Tax=Alkalicoccobacillus gibsonii TaxID=79881 RepID=UPI0019313B13|nr:winged helix-turn-helix domain-containing protein [Alkalicoccobacillus gibsonii]MBM0064755.1 winged helix-turn-helix domain-containing protein [Alkalicoccobacillus gibsonii]